MFKIENAPLAADMIDQAAVARAPAPADSERGRAALAAALAAELRAVFAPEDAPALDIAESDGLRWKDAGLGMCQLELARVQATATELAQR